MNPNSNSQAATKGLRIESLAEHSLKKEVSFPTFAFFTIIWEGQTLYLDPIPQLLNPAYHFKQVQLNPHKRSPQTHTSKHGLR